MKYTFTLLACIAFSIQFSKAQRTDSTQLKLTYGSEISEINALFNLEHVDYFKITSRDTSLKNQYFSFTTKEYWDKNLVKIDTLLRGAGAESISYGKNDTSLVFSLMTKAKNNDTIDFSYNLFKYGTLRPYKKMNSDNYSLRDAINSNGKFVSVPKNKSFPLLVYSLPYKDPKYPGYLFYCELTANGVPPEKWGEKYGVEHYIIVELNIKDKLKSTSR